MISETYSKKIDSCLNALVQFEIDIETIMLNYENQIMPDSKIFKKELFNSILKKDLDDEKIKYMNFKLEKLKHFRDRRQPYEYGIDLILGWIIEDCILIFLKKCKILSKLSGNDRYREFLHPKKISTQPDIEIQTKKFIKKHLEVMFSWKNTWSKSNAHIDLRDNKFKKLEDHKALFLGIEPQSSMGFLIDFEKEDLSDWKCENIAGYGGKPGYTNRNIEKHLKSFRDIANLIKKF